MAWIGVLCVMFAGTMAGFVQAAYFANRPKQLRQLRYGLQRLETEIVYGLTPLPRAMGRVGEQVPEPVGRLFRDAAASLREEGADARECWSRALDANWDRLSLRKPELETLRQFGSSLGISDKEDQTKHLRLTMQQLQAEEEQASEDRRRYEKMWRNLGVLGGALIVVLML